MIKEGEKIYQGAIHEFVQSQMGKTIVFELLLKNEIELKKIIKNIEQNLDLKLKQHELIDESLFKYRLSIESKKANHEVVGFLYDQGALIESVQPQSGLFSEFLEKNSKVGLHG
jgi:hypothetical protein